MMRLLSSALVVLLVVPQLAFAASFEVSAWLPYWHEDTAAQSARAHLDQLTEINPFSYTVNTKGELVDLMGVGEEPWKSLIAEAKAKRVRVIPTVMWADQAAIYRILSNYTSRVKLEDDILALVEREGFDGIDIDFENKSYETRDYYSTFLKGLQMRFPKKWVMCTIESRTPVSSRYLGTPPAGAGQYVNDFPTMNRYCDRVRIMAYDQGTIDQKLNAAANGAPYIPVADVRWVEKTLQEALAVFPKYKVSVGVPTYGYEFVVKPLSSKGFSYERVRAFNQGYAYDLIARYATQVTRNAAGELSFTYIPTATGTVTPDTEPVLERGAAVTLGALSAQTVTNTAAVASQGTYNIVWWSDAQAIKDKVDLAKKYGIRGVSIFKVDGQEDPALWDILPRVR